MSPLFPAEITAGSAARSLEDLGRVLRETTRVRAARGSPTEHGVRITSEILPTEPGENTRETSSGTTVTDVGADRCRVEMTADQLEWPAMALGSLGAEFRVLEPEDLRVYLLDWSQRFARATA